MSSTALFNTILMGRANPCAIGVQLNSNHRTEANVHILAGYVLPWVFDKMPDHGSS